MNSQRAFGEVSSPIAIPSLRFSSVILRPSSAPMDVLSRDRWARTGPRLRCGCGQAVAEQEGGQDAHLQSSGRRRLRAAGQRIAAGNALPSTTGARHPIDDGPGVGRVGERDRRPCCCGQVVAEQESGAHDAHLQSCGMRRPMAAGQLVAAGDALSRRRARGIRLRLCSRMLRNTRGLQ